MKGSYTDNRPDPMFYGNLPEMPVIPLDLTAAIVLIVGQRGQIITLTTEYERYKNAHEASERELAKVQRDAHEEIAKMGKQIASLEGDNEILRNMGKILKDSVEALAARRIGTQEPLGEDFQKVLDDNRDKLYEDGALRGGEVKDEQGH